VVVEAPPALSPELLDDGSDDVRDPDPEPAGKPVPEGATLASIAKETWIYATPRWGARRIGYLRAGAVVGRRKDPAGYASCEGGWYRVEPKGYVCVGAFATLDRTHPVVAAATRRPSEGPLPYTYVMSRFPTPPLYARLPNEPQEITAEPDLQSHLRKLAAMQRDPSFVPLPEADPMPDLLLDGRPLPALANVWRSPDAVVLDHAHTRSGFALLSTFEHLGRRFGMTTELALIPLDRTRVIKPSTMEGIKLDDRTTLPVAFVRSHFAVRWKVREDGGIEKTAALGFREAVPISGRTRTMSGARYVEATDGTWLREEQITRVEPMKRAPAWSDRKWIDVSILHQSLIAYEGKKPVYATLVSTGIDGLGDPKKTHSTILGAFLIHTKHVSVTMDGDDVGDEFDLRDVPYVQYFTEGFALHGAYWHDEFGTPHSHGCVNLAPIDAAWLFNWTDPEVPAGWHAALTLKKGTLVYIHP
jgi:hypothetical protein